MSWTYNVTQLSTLPLYQVRNIIGDVDEDDPLLQDEEIEYELTLASNDLTVAAIACCEKIASRSLKKVDYSLGPYSVRLSQRAKLYAELAVKLTEGKASYKFSAPVFTGDPERTSIFDIDMMINESCDHIEED